MCAWGTRVHIVFRNSRPQLSLSVLLGVSDGFSFSSYGFSSCVTGVGFVGVRVRTCESNSTFVWYCVTVFWPLPLRDGFSNHLCLQVHRFVSIPIHRIISSYRMFNPDPATRCFCSCFWCHLLTAHVARLLLVFSSKFVSVPYWRTGVKMSVMISKVCRMFLHSVTQTQLQVVWFLIINVFFSLNVFHLGISDNSVSVYSTHHPNHGPKRPLLASVHHIYFACRKKSQINDIHICPTCRGQR